MEIEYKTKIGTIKFNSKDINGIIGNKLSDIEEIIKTDNESIDKIIPILEDEYVRSNNPKFRIGILYSKKIVMDNETGSN